MQHVFAKFSFNTEGTEAQRTQRRPLGNWAARTGPSIPQGERASQPARAKRRGVTEMLDFSFSRRVPLILQTEAAECGHACVAMVASHHGHRIDLATLRQRHSVSLRGSTLADL